jgi:D-sedoheptulose 7-phosphate isomerase
MNERTRLALAGHEEVLTRMAPVLSTADQLAAALVEAYARGGRVFTFGNGGSAADAQHFAEELVGRFQRERRPLPAQSLGADGSLLTCIGNDYAFDDVFERQIRAFARAGDVAIGFSTSGRSPNVVAGLAAARELGATAALFSGGDGGPAAAHADHALLVPATATARIQEMHVFLLHVVLDQVDAWAAGEQAAGESP